MMTSLTVEQMRELDRRTEETYGIPTLLLMENAGREVANTVNELFKKHPNSSQIIILCGTGNNAGDGFVAARYLQQYGIRCRVCLMDPYKTYQGDAETNFQIVKKLGLEIFSFSQLKEELKSKLRAIPLIFVDAILGTGFRKPLSPAYLEAFHTLNVLKRLHNAKVTIISVDVPSGVSGNEGLVGSEAIRADVTVTFSCRKVGMEKPGALMYLGKVEVVDIGVPHALLNEIARKKI